MKLIVLIFNYMVRKYSGMTIREHIEMGKILKKRIKEWKSDDVVNLVWRRYGKSSRCGKIANKRFPADELRHELDNRLASETSRAFWDKYMLGKVYYGDEKFPMDDSFRQ